MALIDLRAHDAVLAEAEAGIPEELATAGYVMRWRPIAEPLERPMVCLFGECEALPTQEAVHDLPHDYAAWDGSRFYTLITVACDEHAQGGLR